MTQGGGSCHGVDRARCGGAASLKGAPLGDACVGRAHDGRSLLAVEVIGTAELAFVRLTGELDAATSADLRGTLIALAGKDLEVDIEALRFIDASGLGALAHAAVACRLGGHRLVVRRPSPLARRLLQICQLEELLLGQHTLDG